MDKTHDLSWLVEWLRYRIGEMKPRERTLNLKLSKAGARLLLSNLEDDLLELRQLRTEGGHE